MEKKIYRCPRTVAIEIQTESLLDALSNVENEEAGARQFIFYHEERKKSIWE